MPAASKGVAFSRLATSFTLSVGTYRNSAFGSTKRVINHGHAIRSTFAFSRVTHFTISPRAASPRAYMSFLRPREEAFYQGGRFDRRARRLVLSSKPGPRSITVTLL